MMEPQVLEPQPGEVNDEAIAPVENPPMQEEKQEAAPPAKMKVRFGGAIFQFDANAKPEFIQETFKNFKKTPEFDRLLDKKRGSPATIRGLVDELENDEDKLATLKNYYPDADFYGEDNFVYTDPETGKFTLHNPPGFEAGDVAGYARTGTEIVASGLGAGAGFLGGAAVGLPSGPGAIATSTTGAVLGAGIGAEAGVAMFDFFTSIFGGRVQTKSVPERITESAVRVGVAGLGEAAGPVIVSRLKKGITGGTDAAAKLAQKFFDLGIDPVASAITPGKLLARGEAALEQAATAANTLYKQAERVVSQTSDALDNIISKVGVVREKTAAGEALKTSVESAIKRKRLEFNVKYDEVFDSISPDTLVDDMTAVDDVIEPYLADLASLPKEVLPDNAVLKMVKKFDTISKMAKSGQLTFRQFRKFRSELLKEQRKLNPNTSGALDSLVDDLSDAMRLDMSSAAQSIDPAAANALTKVDGEYRTFKEGAQKTFDKIQKFDADERAFDYILLSAKSKGPEGVKALKRLRENFTDDEWGDVVASVFYDLGREKASQQSGQVAQFSIATFMTRFSEIRRSGPEALEAMFKGTQFEEVVPELEKFVEVVSALKDVRRIANVSQTSGALHSLLTLQVLGGGLGAAMTGGSATGLASGAVGSIVAPWVSAKLITSPSFVKWLSTPATEVSKNISAHMGRLTAIAAAEPAIAEHIELFSQSLRKATQVSNMSNQEELNQ